MHRGRVASKVRLDITCRPLKSSEAMAVLSAIKPEFVTVRYIDPQDGSVTRRMYSNNIPTICATVNPDGTAIWKGLTFPLIEGKKPLRSMIPQERWEDKPETTNLFRKTNL